MPETFHGTNVSTGLATFPQVRASFPQAYPQISLLLRQIHSSHWPSVVVHSPVPVKAVHGSAARVSALEHSPSARPFRGGCLPNRIIRDGILTSRIVAALTDDGEIFYRRLMSIVDDYGRFECDLDILRARLFPLSLARWQVSRIERALKDCKSLVQIYTEKHKKYLQISNFKQQTRSPSKYPDPPCVADAQQCCASASNCQHLISNDINCSPSRSRIPEAEAESNAEAVEEPSPKTGSGELVIVVRSPGEIAEPYAVAIHGRHIARRCSLKSTRELLTAILRKALEENRLDLVQRIDRNHAAHCESFDWLKDGGQFCPSLDKWLNIKKERYLIEPSNFTPVPDKAHEKRSEVLALAKIFGEMK